jgi:hypothetical protein
MPEDIEQLARIKQVLQRAYGTNAIPSSMTPLEAVQHVIKNKLTPCEPRFVGGK